MTIVVDVVDDKLEIDLTARQPDNGEPEVKEIWSSKEGELNLLIKVLANDILVVKDTRILNNEDDIKSQFAEQHFELEKARLEATASGIELTQDNEQDVSKQEIRPYNPDLIRVDTKAFTIHQIFKLIQDDDIDFSPDFQRHFVWKEREKKSRLIESIMLRIPLPVFYFAQDYEGKFQIVDGLQRLTVIKDFLNNKFRLKRLEYLKDLEDKFFSKRSKKDPIDVKYVRRIEQATLTINIIDPQTPTSVKFEIFKRINQGGKPLKPQEIRNCMSSKRTRNLLQTLSSSVEFKEATDYSINGLRMEDQELVLRFCGFFYLRIKDRKEFKYSGNMELFLDETLDILNSENDSTMEEIENLFIRGMQNAFHLFGEYSFRKCLKKHLLPGAKRQFINKSLFTTYSIILAKLDNEAIKKIYSKGFLVEKLANELEANPKFLDNITNGTNDANRLNYSFEIAEKLVSQNILL